MQERLNSPIPPKQQFAGTLKLIGQVSYWVHLILGATSLIILGLIVFSRRLEGTPSSTAISVGIFAIIASLVTLGIRIFMAWRYSRMAKKLQTNTPNNQPQRSEIIAALKLGLFTSILGLVLAFIASETTIVTVIAQAIAQPQTTPIYEPQQAVETADLFLDFVSITVLGAHVLGTIDSLSLLNWITRE